MDHIFNWCKLLCLYGQLVDALLQDNFSCNTNTKLFYALGGSWFTLCDVISKTHRKSAIFRCTNLSSNIVAFRFFINCKKYSNIMIKHDRTYAKNADCQVCNHQSSDVGFSLIFFQQNNIPASVLTVNRRVMFDY